MQIFTQNKDTLKEKTVTLKGAGAINGFGEAMQKIAPIGAGILLICDENIFDTLGIGVERALRRVPYSVARDLSIVKSGLDKKFMDAFTLAEGVRAVVGVGGGAVADGAKYIAKKYGLALALVATSFATISFFEPTSILLEDGFYVKIVTLAPQIFVADYDIISTQTSSHLASGFGELTSRILSIFEYKFYCITSGKPLQNKCVDALEQILDGVLTALKGYTRGVNGVLELVVECAERLCREDSLAENGIMFCGADSGFCASVAMLFSYEKRVCKMWGENSFVLSRILVKVYRQILEMEEFFMPPPSANKRIKALKEYYGVSEVIASKHVTQVLPIDNLRLKLYRLNEYKSELFDAITQADSLLEEAYKIFKRLYDDDGYSLINYIESPDAQLTIALAPDCLEQDTMLSLLKNIGFLEKYIF